MGDVVTDEEKFAKFVEKFQKEVQDHLVNVHEVHNKIIGNQRELEIVEKLEYRMKKLNDLTND